MYYVSQFRAYLQSGYNAWSAFQNVFGLIVQDVQNGFVRN